MVAEKKNLWLCEILVRDNNGQLLDIFSSLSSGQVPL